MAPHLATFEIIFLNTWQYRKTRITPARTLLQSLPMGSNAPNLIGSYTLEGIWRSGETLTETALEELLLSLTGFVFYTESVKLPLLLIAIFLNPSALYAATSDCWNSDRSFYDCSLYGKGSFRKSHTTSGDSLISNPASIPTQTTTLGLEAVYSERSFRSEKHKWQFSTIKGFEGIGFGVGNWTEGSFLAPNFHDHFMDTEFQNDYVNYVNNQKSKIGIRLGTAIRLPTRFLPKNINFSIGGSLGQGEVSGTLSKQLGAIAKIYFLGIGYSQSFERLSVALPRPRVDLLSGGLFIRNFYLGYSLQTVKSLTTKTNAKIYVASWDHPKWSVLFGVKNYIDHRGISQNWLLGKINRKLGRRVGVGYIYGLYPLSHSLSLQFFL